MKTLTRRQLQQAPARARHAADDGPLIVTDRGKPAYVLLSYDDYRHLPGIRFEAAPAVGSAHRVGTGSGPE